MSSSEKNAGRRHLSLCWLKSTSRMFSFRTNSHLQLTRVNVGGLRSLFRQCMSLIYVMRASTRCFSETSHDYRRKLCGSCVHVNFGLTKEECAFLMKMIATHSSEVIWGSWIPQKGNVKRVGASRQLDPEKVRFVKMLMEHIRYCPHEKAWVSFIDQDCFRWQPQKDHM